MDRDDWYSQENRNERALERTREDFRDLQNELAGRETGRAYRFTSEEERERRTGRSSAERSAQARNQLQLLLSQPDYAEDYNRVMEMLIEAELRTQLAIDQTEKDLNQNDRELDDIQSRASTLPDGTRVYRDEDGNVFNEEGEQILPPDTDAIVWRDDNPSYEDYLRNRERDTAQRDYLDRLRDYQINVLGYIRGRMTDSNDPATDEELEGFEKDIVEQEPKYADARTETSSDFDQVRGQSLNAAIPEMS